MEKASYGRFLAMVGTGTAVMFVVMYLNTWAFDHALWSWTRFYMAMMMAGTMAAVMLLFMLPMYKNRRANGAIFVGSAVLFLAGLGLVRSQVLVGDVAWMRAMVPPPLDRDPDERAGGARGRAGARAGVGDHRDAAAGDRGDEDADLGSGVRA